MILLFGSEDMCVFMREEKRREEKHAMMDAFEGEKEEGEKKGKKYYVK